MAETDEEARRQFEDHWWYFVRRLLPGIEISPPGYTSLRSVENILKGRGTFALSLSSWDQVVDGQYAIVVLTSNLGVREVQGDIVADLGYFDSE